MILVSIDYLLYRATRMTSQYATNSREIAARLNHTTTSQQVERGTLFPIEGQIPITYQSLPTGPITNFDPYFEYTQLVAGTAITLTNAQLLNCVNRELTFKCNTPGAATTLTLAGGAVFNQGATTVATFDAVNESVLVIFVTAPVAGGIPLVHVKSSRNVTYA